MKIPLITELINFFSTIPGVGTKSAERFVFALIKKDNKELEKFAFNLNELKKLKNCKICNNLTFNENCEICEDEQRINNIICVVDDIKNIILLENNNIFNGRYFLLNNLINPIQGVDIEKINFKQLESMIKKFKASELLLALKSSIEGETTALYISKIYKNKIKITKLAQGVPLGTEIEYLDLMTIEQAFKDRKEI